MSSYGIPIPPRYDHSPPDRTAAQEAYEQAVSREMNPEAITEYFLDLVSTKLHEAQGNALSDMRTLLRDAPIFDGYDLEQYAQVGGPGDQALARLVRRLYGEAVLAEYKRAVDRLGDVPF